MMTMSDRTLLFELSMRKPMKKLIVDNTTTDHNKIAIKHAATGR